MDGWTRERPTEEGLFWFTGVWGILDIPVTAVWVRQWHKKGVGWDDGERGLAVFTMGDEKAFWLHICDGYWQGPITPPAPPQPQQEEGVGNG